MTWEPKSEATRERLRALWLQVPQLSTAEIGRQMGASKNAVVSLAHRLDLPARPSPIIKNADGTPYVRKAYIPRRQKLTLPHLASAEPITLAASSPVSPVRAVKPAFAAPPPKPAAPLPYRRVTTCSYVTDIGRFGVGVTFCDDPTIPGKVYCPSHAALCYARVRNQEVADAAD